MSGPLTLFVPGLLQAFSVRSQPTAPALPSLDRLLVRADCTPFPGNDKGQELATLFQARLPKPLPAAALSWAGDHKHPISSHCLRADPVHVHPDRDRLLLFDARHLNVSNTEATALLSSLNAHLKPLDMVLHAPHPERWYLHLNRSPVLQTTPLDQATGRDVLRYLPSGDDGPEWRTLLNEMQMLLHQHPINEQREEQGRPTINSLWFWGNGDTPAPFEPPFSQVLTTDPIVRGLAHLSNTPIDSIPRNATQWLTDIAAQSPARDRNYLVHLDQIHQAQTLADPSAWFEALQQLEQAWLIPLTEALTDGHLTDLTLVGSNGHQYHVTRRGLRRWWRRDRPWTRSIVHA